LAEHELVSSYLSKWPTGAKTLKKGKEEMNGNRGENKTVISRMFVFLPSFKATGRAPVKRKTEKKKKGEVNWDWKK